MKTIKIKICVASFGIQPIDETDTDPNHYKIYLLYLQILRY